MVLIAGMLPAGQFDRYGGCRGGGVRRKQRRGHVLGGRLDRGRKFNYDGHGAEHNGGTYRAQDREQRASLLDRDVPRQSRHRTRCHRYRKMVSYYFCRVYIYINIYMV